ncbi:MAG: hypothetical protein WBW88_15785 [Rhodothermales bacterium]
MKLDSKALAITLAVVWGVAVFLVALVNMIWPSYGLTFLDLASSIYPGFHPGGLVSAVVGGLYAALDGAVLGVLVGWIYNKMSTKAPAV